MIKNAIGGSGSDRTVGNKLANLMEGRYGNDHLAGEDGNLAIRTSSLRPDFH
jgi:hypothetical protein